jgi:hypothetical protein
MTKYDFNTEPGNKHLVKIFKKDLQTLLKYGLTKNNIMEFYFSCNSVGHAINPYKKDLEQWIEEELESK